MMKKYRIFSTIATAVIATAAQTDKMIFFFIMSTISV